MYLDHLWIQKFLYEIYIKIEKKGLGIFFIKPYLSINNASKLINAE